MRPHPYRAESLRIMADVTREPPAAREAESPVPPEPEGPAKKTLRFPTAFTVLAAVLLLVWIAAFFVPAGAYDTKDGGPVPGTYHRLPNCSSAPEGEQCVDTSARLPLQAAVDRAAERPLRRRERPGAGRPERGRLPLRLGADLPVRPGGRRVHHGHDEDRGDPDRHRTPRDALLRTAARCWWRCSWSSSRSAARRTACGRRPSASSRCSCRSRSRWATTAWSRRRSSSSGRAPA